MMKCDAEKRPRCHTRCHMQLVADRMRLHVEEELGIPYSDQFQSMLDYYFKNTGRYDHRWLFYRYLGVL